MPRYIDADAILKDMCAWCTNFENDIPVCKEKECAYTLLVKSAPTADVQEVVLCKDCKHRDPEDKKCDSFVRFKNPFPTDDDDFCPYGKRKG